MAKSNFYNSIKAKEEAEKKEIATQEKSEMLIYMEKLRKDKRFQKYIINGIIKPNIESLSDTRKIIEIAGKGKEALADLVLANVKARATLESILNNLL